MVISIFFVKFCSRHIKRIRHTRHNRHTGHTYFDMELQELYRTLSLVISNSNYYGRTSGKFTHVSNAHGTSSWLDPVICRYDMLARL